jgi:hypothetical protein
MCDSASDCSHSTLLWNRSHQREQLPIRTYTTADGLARDRVYKIVPDPHGFLWFCTYDGLSRFDGYEFVNYSVEHGFPHRSFVIRAAGCGNGAWIQRTRFESNEVGLLHSGGNSAAVSNSVGSGNGIAFLTAGGGRLELFHTVASKNQTGVKADGGIRRIAYCSVTGNGTGMSESGGTIGQQHGCQQRYRRGGIDQRRNVRTEVDEKL